MNITQILIIVLIVFLLTSVLFLFALPTTKKEMDKSIAKFEVYRPREKRLYFGVHHFSSGWDAAKKTPGQFVVFVLLLPMIFISWLLWVLFGRGIPKDFERVFPRGSGGRKKGSTVYPEDDKAFQMVQEGGMEMREVWRIMRPEYCPDDRWNTLDKIQKDQEFNRFRKRIENRFNDLDNNS